MFPQCDTERGARRNRRADGFSLVETALAMAIVCFAFIPLLGLLPIGVSTMREAKDDIVAARIVQQIGNEAQQADFEALVSTGSLRYFDDQSRELPASQREASVYQSQTIVLSDPATPHLKRLVVQVVRNPGTAATLKEQTLPGGGTIWSHANNLPVVTRSLLLAKSSSIVEN